ncbi:hypothetical protein EV426DRAFT_578640 [Tirmania nivea]|nr:hypothetical protein EV426DRAFT_578640 [Tirmania nivea]
MYEIFFTIVFSLTLGEVAKQRNNIAILMREIWYFRLGKALAEGGSFRRMVLPSLLSYHTHHTESSLHRKYTLQIPHERFFSGGTRKTQYSIPLVGKRTQLSDAAWRERAKVLALQSNLEGKAKQFLINLRADKKTTYDAAARALRQRFPPQFNEVYRFPESVKAYEKPKARNRSGKNGYYCRWVSGVSGENSVIYLSDEDLGLVPETIRLHTRDSVIYIEHLSIEDLGLVVPETETAGTIIISDELVVGENQSENLRLVVPETDQAGMVSIADELVESMEKDSVIYIELSDEDLGLVIPETDPVGMITIGDELVESVEKESVVYIEHLSDEASGLVVLETDPAGMITIAAKLVVDENQSEGNYLQQVQGAIDQTPYTQTMAYIEHLSNEDSGLVSKGNDHYYT